MLSVFWKVTSWRNRLFWRSMDAQGHIPCTRRPWAMRGERHHRRERRCRQVRLPKELRPGTPVVPLRCRDLRPQPRGYRPTRAQTHRDSCLQWDSGASSSRRDCLPQEPDYDVWGSWGSCRRRNIRCAVPMPEPCPSRRTQRHGSYLFPVRCRSAAYRAECSSARRKPARGCRDARTPCPPTSWGRGW